MYHNMVGAVSVYLLAYLKIVKLGYTAVKHAGRPGIARGIDSFKAPPASFVKSVAAKPWGCVHADNRPVMVWIPQVSIAKNKQTNPHN